MIKNIFCISFIVFIFIACTSKDRSSYNNKAAQYQEAKAKKAYKELE